MQRAGAAAPAPAPEPLTGRGSVDRPGATVAQFRHPEGSSGRFPHPQRFGARRITPSVQHWNLVVKKQSHRAPSNKTST